MPTPLWRVSGSQWDPVRRLIARTVDTSDAGPGVTADLAFGSGGSTAATTGAAGFTVGLAGAASSSSPTTGGMPITVGLAGAVGTTGAAGFTVGLAGAVSLPYGATVLADSPLLDWKVDESSGTTAADSSGHSKAGTYNGSPTLGGSPLINAGTAVTFGSGKYVSLAAEASLSTASYSVEVWIQTTSTAQMNAVTRYGASNGSRYRIKANWASVGTVTVQNDDNFQAVTSTTTTLNDGLPHHIVMVQDSTTLYLYVDGVLEASTASTPSGGTASEALNLGSDNAGGTNWVGKLDEFAVYGYALSASQVGTHYAAGTLAGATTGAAGFTVGLDAAASTSVTTTGAAGFTVGLSASAATEGTTTGAMPFTVGLSGVGISSTTTGAVGFTVGLAAVASGGDAILGGWTDDFSQQAVVDLTGPESDIAGSLVITRTPATAPAAITEQVLVRHSHQMSALVPDAAGRVHDAGTYTIDVAQIGVPHVWVNGQDVTYFRDAPTEIGEWASSLPFGDDTAVIKFPQMTPWDVAGTGDLDWLYKDAPVHIAIIDADGNVVPGTEWFGRIVSDESGNTESDIEQGWHCRGDMSQAAEFMHQPPIRFKTPQDIGTVIPRALNGVVSRRYGTLATVTTGITTLKRGAYSDTVAEYAQSLLAEAWTSGARQWTVGKTSVPRRYSVQLKPDVTNPASSTFTVTSGAPGVEVSLSSDGDQRIDAIFGKGVGPKGEGWAGWVWPGLLVDNAPDYPFTSASNVISLGTTDADTDSGDGVSTWQERARALGYKTVEVDGTFRTDDRDACKAIQRRYGILVDGIVGPQTWAATFAVGSNAGSLDGAYRAPLAIRTGCEPYLYSASGAKVGTNPAYNPDLVRREIHIDYGSGVTKAEARLSAQDQLDRSSDPGWVGTVTFTKTDPWEKSRWEITEGEVFTLKGWRGADVLLSVVDVRKSLTSVTLTVDSKARDAMTVSSILARDRDAKIDPARRPGNVNRRSRMERDQIVEYDSESGAGRVPKFALYGGLWSVIHIPLSEAGTLALTELTTSSPASEFYVGMFASPITAAHMVQYVGDPSQADAWNTNVETLESRFGYITSWGNDGEACGHFPYDSTGPVTGKFKDGGSLAYDSNEGGWVWLAFYSPRSCFIRGRFYPQPIE